MYLTDNDRAALQETLLKAIPNRDEAGLRTVLTLLFALLCDYRELEAARRADAQKYLEQLKSIEGFLRKLHEREEEPQAAAPHLWQ